MPTKAPTKVPTKAPTKVPTKAPTKQPTQGPTTAPTDGPTTKGPTLAPTQAPTVTREPTAAPSPGPLIPQPRPTAVVTAAPTATAAEISVRILMSVSAGVPDSVIRKRVEQAALAVLDGYEYEPAANNETEAEADDDFEIEARRYHRFLQDKKLPAACTATTNETSDDSCQAGGLGQFSYKCLDNDADYVCCRKNKGRQVNSDATGKCKRNKESAGTLVPTADDDDDYDPLINPLSVVIVPSDCGSFQRNTIAGNKCVQGIITLRGETEASIAVFTNAIETSVENKVFEMILEEANLSVRAELPPPPALSTDSPTPSPTGCLSICEYGTVFDRIDMCVCVCVCCCCC